jgi:glycyl-tRNA synthetase (class II)
MADVVVRLEMKIAELDLKEHETARGNDEDVQAGVALEKITKEFEAKLIKILSDAEDRQAQREMELAIAAMSRNDNGEERQESGRMRRQGDLSEVRSGLVELENKTTAKLAKISDALEEISNTDFVFERDPVTKRIAKATRARRLQ